MRGGEIGKGQIGVIPEELTQFHFEGAGRYVRKIRG
jgi:hypothetical protein